MIEVNQTSSATPDAIWTVLGDVENWGRSLPTFESVRHLSGPSPTAVGSRFEVRQPGLAKATYEVTEWSPGRNFTWVGHAPGVATTAIHRIEASDSGSELRLGIEWTGPLAGVIRLLLKSKAQRMMQSEAETIARLAEQP